ncbi:hypothetical protein CBL_10426 [Carabus blaptoides fortunei]
MTRRRAKYRILVHQNYLPEITSYKLNMATDVVYLLACVRTPNIEGIKISPILISGICTGAGIRVCNISDVREYTESYNFGVVEIPQTNNKFDERFRREVGRMHVGFRQNDTDQESNSSQQKRACLTDYWSREC